MVFLLIGAALCWRYQRALRQRFLDTLNAMEERTQWSTSPSSESVATSTDGAELGSSHTGPTEAYEPDESISHPASDKQLEFVQWRLR